MKKLLAIYNCKCRITFLLLIALFLSACGGIGSIPPEKQDYIGTWHGQYMVLSISAEAQVEYQYEKGNVSKSISAPITEFIGDDFKVGALGMDTLFVVNKPPYFENGVWKMIVDDQLVIRKAN
ncbi:hypothetical protein RCS94_09380 [Orbaceae bacterium ac157xtp]